MVKFEIVLMTFLLFCHQLYINHLTGVFIQFRLMTERLEVFSRKTSQCLFLLDPNFCRFSEKAINFFSIFSQVQSRSDDVCFVLPSTLQYSREK